MARPILLCAIALFLAGCGDDDETPASATATSTPAPAASACKVTDHPEEGADHTVEPRAPADYRTNPPTSGDHHPEWYEDGVYPPGATTELGKVVHAQEHGRVVIQYKPGTDPASVDRLEALVTELEGYHLLLIENGTQMPAALAATTWTKTLSCASVDDAAIEALRSFHRENVDKAPEQVP